MKINGWAKLFLFSLTGIVILLLANFAYSSFTANPDSNQMQGVNQSPQMQGMSGTQMPAMNTSQMQGMAGTQMPGMNTSQMQGMSGTQVPGMNQPSQMQGIAGTQMPGMQPEMGMMGIGQ